VFYRNNKFIFVTFSGYYEWRRLVCNILKYIFPIIYVPDLYRPPNQRFFAFIIPVLDVFIVKKTATNLNFLIGHITFYTAPEVFFIFFIFFWVLLSKSPIGDFLYFIL